MQVTDVRVRKIEKEGKMKAIVSIFRRGQIIHLGINVRILFKEVITDLRFQEIHICLVIGFHRSNIAPVGYCM
mgnify:CR=1 FL=1